MGVGLGLALVASMTFGTSGIFARSLIEAGWSPAAAVTARIAVASAILALPTVLALRGNWHVLRRNLGRLSLFGVVSVAGAQVGFFNAVRYLPVGIALLIEYLGILLVVGWMWAVHKQRPGRLTLAGAAAALLGLVLVLDLSGGGLHPAGVGWGLVAAVGLAAYFVMAGRVDPQLPSVVLASGGMAVGAVVLALLGVAGALPMQASFDQVTFAGQRMSWLVPVLGLSLVAAVIAYVAGIGASRILGARLSSFVGLTEVLFAIAFAWLLLGELPTVIQLIGGLLIVAGVAFVRADELRREPAGQDAGTPPDPGALRPVADLAAARGARAGRGGET
jgi:drug/metabolite transporter (DMT)-like permease